MDPFLDKRLTYLEKKVEEMSEMLSYLIDARDDAPDKVTGFGDLDAEHGARPPRFGSDENF